MASIEIDKSHKALIQAAINLGDWLLGLDGLSDVDRQAVRSVQDALGRLPKIKDGTLAMYGFSIERGDENSGLIRGWDVSLEYFANDPEQQGGVEMFSSYIPVPETTDAQILAEKKQNETYFHWAVGNVAGPVFDQQARRWIEEISQPLQYMDVGDRLRVEIVYQDYYSDLEFPAV